MTNDDFKKSSGLKKQIIPVDKLKSISVEMDGKKYCFEGKVIVNGIHPTHGIKSFELVLIANEYPQIFIVGTPLVIRDDVKEILGLTESNWEPLPEKQLDIDPEVLNSLPPLDI